MAHIGTGAVAPSVSINGVYCSNVLAVHVSSTSCFSADTFTVTLAISSAIPGEADFWASLQMGYVEVYRKDLGGRLISGMIDSLSIDLLRGIVRISGRDLSSLLIDTSPERDFVNQTPAEIVSAIAAKHGLAADIAPVTDISGRFYGDDFTRLSLAKFSRARSEWDLIVQLAREAGFDAYIKDRTLHFLPATNSAKPPFLLTQDTILSLRVERALWVNEIPFVQVSSWNSQEGAAYSQSTGSPDVPSTYIFTGANMTESQVTLQAKQYFDELNQIRQNLRVDMPWTDTLSVRDLVLLSGTGGTFDNLYRVKAVDHHFSSKSGCLQHIVLSDYTAQPAE